MSSLSIDLYCIVSVRSHRKMNEMTSMIRKVILKIKNSVNCSECKTEDDTPHGIRS